MCSQAITSENFLRITFSLIDVFNPRDEEVVNIAYSLLIPNLLFVLSLVVLIYWYCPYCQARCKKYEQADMDME